jgi:hypothetical protein
MMPPIAAARPAARQGLALEPALVLARQARVQAERRVRALEARAPAEPELVAQVLAAVVPVVAALAVADRNNNPERGRLTSGLFFVQPIFHHLLRGWFSRLACDRRRLCRRYHFFRRWRSLEFDAATKRAGGHRMKEAAG